MNCKHCGRWSGLVGDEHMDCAAMAAKGIADARIAVIVAQEGGSAPEPVTGATIYWAVLGALVTFAALAAVIELFIYLASAPPTH